MFRELPNASPEGSIRPGGGAVTDGRSVWASPGDFEEGLGGGNSVGRHDGKNRWS